MMLPFCIVDLCTRVVVALDISHVLARAVLVVDLHLVHQRTAVA